MSAQSLLLLLDRTAMLLHARCSIQLLILFVLVHVVSITYARDVTVFTQTNISTQYLTDPALNLPFTSFLYISAGQNGTAQPPATIRITKIPDNATIPYTHNVAGSSPDTTYSNASNATTSEEAGATILYIQHLSNFSLPAAINAPSGITWHANNVGEIKNETAVDPHTLMRTWGTGLLADIWQIIAMEFDKKYWIPFADENIYILKLLEQWGFSDKPGYQSYNRQLNSWRALTTGAGETKQVRVNVMRIDMSSEGVGQVYKNDLNKILEEGLKEAQNAEIRSVEFLNHAENPNSYVPRSLEPSDSASSLHGTQNLNIRGPIAPNTVYETKVTFVRQNGIFSTLSVISEETATILNELVRVAAIAICIVDFVDGNYVGGLLGLIGVAFASILPIFLNNPIGILYGTLIAILFFILPGVFRSGPTYAMTKNSTQVIQFSFFGDAKHTGNEKCAKEHPGCVASYGPGILALSFKWEWFDAIVFMIWANQGFPMTIPDMAKAFGTPVAYDKDLSTNSSVVAQISCGGFVGITEYPGRMGVMQWTHGNPNVCLHPSFHLNRSNIILPRINRTAADVYNDIISPHRGSCKIIDNVDNPVTVPNYGIQIQGLPVAIACGINASVPGINIVSGNQVVNNVTSGPGTPTSSTISSSIMSSSAKSSSTNLSSGSTTSTSGSTASPIKSSGISGVSASGTTQTASSHSGSATVATTNSDVEIVTIPTPSTSTAVPSGRSPGSLSTDGRTGEGWVPPPAPEGFANSTYPGNSACFNTDTIWGFCLPNGTYDYQSGGFSFNSHQSIGVNFPQGSSIIVRYYVQHPRSVRPIV